MRYVVVVAVIFGAGCVKESPYRFCDLDPNSPNEEVATCGGSMDVSCVVVDQIQCDSRTCGRYEGAAPVCTARCAQDGDCEFDGDVCRPWGTLGTYCTPADLVK